MPTPTLLRSLRRYNVSISRHVSTTPNPQIQPSSACWKRTSTYITCQTGRLRPQTSCIRRVNHTKHPYIPFACRSSASATRTTPPKSLQDYTPPTSGLLSFLPKAVVPYAELIRLDKPTGTYYLFFPCLFSTLVAATMATPMASPTATAGTVALFFTGALVMRGAGCTINDLWDRNLDPHVARTRLRPIARKAISPQAAVIFTGGQLLTGLAVLLSLPFECFWYATPSLLFVTIYPLAKRVTNYPQFVLGLTFSWGAMMGFPALGVDLLSNQAALAAAACLYWSNVAWTVLYDMIYAHMDIKDDAKAGIKSIALKHDKETKAVLTGLAVVQLGLLAGTGVAAGMGPVFFIGSCGSAAVTLGTMIWRVKLKEVKNCWWWFKNGAWFTGGGIALGLAGEYLAQFFGLYNNAENNKDAETLRD
ncbi:4-hydroxybenzoate polyprenyl transferase [Melanomma pulvis-pyrius CBS 109.77]|uniref:4-hydroxybenzoate polyprenyltransferase, mitochondrial n=1 Tax=Melanomma pulvis-pyrius CBS 109.77 TaxID=1314802 RepID=A0A6A6XE30_9PLEO|nr:4-hydroxybenzoate polyprenyl transferase [Melanomma pulvis-pyrius CBS 109.77]